MPLSHLSSARRLGLLGGTFDPIHYGHLMIAEEARLAYALDAVLFIPAAHAPHKTTGQADVEQRFMMVNLATADHPHFIVSRLELDRPGPSYTVDTLRALHAQCPQAELFWLLGADMALDFHNWREPTAIMELAKVVAINRPGYALEPLRHSLEWPDVRRLEFLTVPGLDIAASVLRERLRAGRTIRYLTPEPVCAYIAKEGLYR